MDIEQVQARLRRDGEAYQRAIAGIDFDAMADRVLDAVLGRIAQGELGEEVPPTAE